MPIASAVVNVIASMRYVNRTSVLILYRYHDQNKTEAQPGNLGQGTGDHLGEVLDLFIQLGWEERVQRTQPRDAPPAGAGRGGPDWPPLRPAPGLARSPPCAAPLSHM